jgi:hypothetical protein
MCRAVGAVPSTRDEARAWLDAVRPTYPPPLTAALEATLSR